eukprot:TRINITY_DN2870_c0_g1_i1.p2 TRINITY_DN2870_c0_g1~~TRINITY_DN2870_c0_g1_i1.p2  ORF type:complete len:161 (+),score=44.15 TRINITY_DN2870_c0_g1_i1:197-679(+)
MDSRPAPQPVGLSDVMSDVKRNPGRCVGFSWFVTIIFVLAMVVVSIVTASKNSQSEAIGGDAAAFTALWVLLVLLLVGVTGTVILRKYHTPLAVGLLLGLTSMLSQLLFVLFAVFLALGEESGSHQDSDHAMAAFMFILFFLFLLFSIILAKFRMTVIET